MSVIGIGVDIEEISRFKTAGDKLLRRLFTEKELEFCLNSVNPAQHLAVRFCAKEAAYKALPFKQIALKNIEVQGGGKSRPLLVIHDGRAKDLDIKLSLSHTANTAIAFVTVSTKENGQNN